MKRAAHKDHGLITEYFFLWFLKRNEVSKSETILCEDQLGPTRRRNRTVTWAEERLIYGVNNYSKRLDEELAAERLALRENPGRLQEGLSYRPLNGECCLSEPARNPSIMVPGIQFTGSCLTGVILLWNCPKGAREAAGHWNFDCVHTAGAQLLQSGIGEGVYKVGAGKAIYALVAEC